MVAKFSFNSQIADIKNIFAEGLWYKNQAIVILLGLCPLLAVSNTFTNALGLSIATIVTLLFSNIFICLLKSFIKPEIRLPIFVATIASIVTVIDVFMEVYFNNLHGTLGIFIPLIVTNCLIFARAEMFASKNNLVYSICDALAIGIGYCAVLILLGSIREILALGTLFSDIKQIFPNLNFRITIFANYPKILLFALPSGAFFIVAVLIALRNKIMAIKS